MPLQDDHYRPQYHFSPPANWVNDPNGLVYYQGEYHLFFQYHPDSSIWGPMHWGHAVSSDLVNWQHLPIALFPDEKGTIFSGCAVIDWDNTAGFGKEAMVAIFTHHQERDESQSLAYSTDCGRSWTKYADNPVLVPPDYERDFRDPKVFWYAENGSGYWVMTLAAGDAIRFFTSPDLLHWKPTGIFGVDHIIHFGFWETPDLFPLPVGEGPESRWVLTVGVGKGGIGGLSGMQYFIGQFDGEKFTSENPQNTVLWLDFGADYYAAQSWNDEPNERRVMIGWLNNWQYARVIPTTTWRGVFSLPRELALRQTENGVRLFQQPVHEIFALRKEHLQWNKVTVSPGTNLLENMKGDSFEIIADIQVNQQVSSFGFRLRVGDHEQTTIGYDVQQEKVFIDRSNSGQSSFDDGFARVHQADMTPVQGVVRLQIFLDRISVEVFGNDGQTTLTDTIFPEEQSQGVEFFTQGGEIILNKLDVYKLRPASFISVES